jgi:hypothetical protein
VGHGITLLHFHDVRIDAVVAALREADHSAGTQRKSLAPGVVEDAVVAAGTRSSLDHDLPPSDDASSDGGY